MVSANIIQTFKGGRSSTQLSQSKIVSDPTSLERNVFVLAADDDSNGTIVWNLKNNSNPQVMPSHAKVLAVEVLEAYDETIKFAALSDKKVHLFSSK